jgi:carbonic anhydrase/acetyltransferase-like protein (isoleucine patch superfamily)
MILSYRGRVPRIAASAFIAGSADVIGDVEVGENSSVWFASVLRGDVEPIRVGANSNIQDGSVIHTMSGSPTTVGNWVTVGHRAVLHGCAVEDHCLIGMGAVLLSNVKVGEGSIVAAGALVAENTIIPPRSLYMGFPARFKRQVTEAERPVIDAYATRYIAYKDVYLAEQNKP